MTEDLITLGRSYLDQGIALGSTNFSKLMVSGSNGLILFALIVLVLKVVLGQFRVDGTIGWIFSIIIGLLVYGFLSGVIG